MVKDTGYFKREDSKVEMLQVVSTLRVMFIFLLPWDNPNFMNFTFLVCFSTALLKSFSKHMIMKFYKTIQKLETDYG